MGEEWIRRVMVLGSVPSLGPVVLWDDMEDFLKWTKANGVGDSVLEKSQAGATLVYSGDYSLHVKSRATDAAEDDVVSAYRLTYQRPGKRYRFECSFVPDAAASAKRVDFKVAIETGTHTHHIYVYWDAANTKWTYKDSGGSVSDFTGGSQNLNANQYHRVMFEWDENAGHITRLVCDGLELRGLELDYYTTANVSAVWMRVDVGLVAGAGAPGEIYVDNVLVMEI